MIDPEQNDPGTSGEAFTANPAPLNEAPLPSSTVPVPPSPALDPEPVLSQPDDLHDLLNVPAEDDPLAALRDDPNYSALIKELEYIAAQARLLFQPAEEAPSDEVWNKIQSQLPKNGEEPTDQS